MMQQTSQLQAAISNAVNTLKDGTNEFEGHTIEYRIDKEDRIIISIGTLDGTSLKRDIYGSQEDAFDVAQSTIEVVEFKDGVPTLAMGDYDIKDRYGQPKDWQTPLLEGMTIVADLMSKIKQTDSEPASNFKLACNSCGSDNCGIMIEQDGPGVGLICGTCGIAELLQASKPTP